MPTVQFQKLESDVQFLERNLLNFSRRVTSPYAEDELLRCQAFVVFSHAEIQVYWEAIARRIIREAEQRWTSCGFVNRVIASLLLFRSPQDVSVPKDPSAPHKSGDFSHLLNLCLSDHKLAIDDNNGIKRANMANLFTPLGIFQNDFDEALLILLDQTGKMRGNMVHKSSSVSLRTIRDPFLDEKGDIDKLIAEIRIADERFFTNDFIVRDVAKEM